jgi:precorrin-6x reductase
MLKVPEVHGSFDMVKIFKHIARTMGAKNVEEFVKVTNNTQARMMPDEQVAREVERGNLQPVGG